MSLNRNEIHLKKAQRNIVLNFKTEKKIVKNGIELKKRRIQIFSLTSEETKKNGKWDRHTGNAKSGAGPESSQRSRLSRGGLLWVSECLTLRGERGPNSTPRDPKLPNVFKHFLSGKGVKVQIFYFGLFGVMGIRARGVTYTVCYTKFKSHKRKYRQLFKPRGQIWGE